MNLTNYHAKYFAHDLTKRSPSDSIEMLAGVLADAQVDLNPHQIEAALFAFRNPFSRGAILADEVGLGKTIEAGLLLAQRWAERKRKLLVIVPANLRKQWSQELADKFYLPSVILETRSFNEAIRAGNLNPFAQNSIVLCSYQFARSKEPYLRQVAWDLVVIDEAHRLRNVYKTSSRIALAIKEAVAPFPKVLLTATPLQNSLLELYGLVTAHAGTDRISGSPTADLRAALVDHFRDEASILIATEAAAEGINLQFCNLVVNYDLPWNPQRIEQRIGRCHDRVQGAHHERDGVERPDRTPSRAELQQQERTGITGKRVKEEVTAAFRASDGPEAFRAALQGRGYTLARGDRRDYVILDSKGGIHSLARRIDGMKAAELREFLLAINPESVPNIKQAREIIEERARRARELEESHDEARIEAGYSHGDDYVSQSRAAMRDHRRRQRAAEEATDSGKVEMIDARRRRLDRLAAASKENDRARDRTEDDPGRQNEAPGGGHTRSR